MHGNHITSCDYPSGLQNLIMMTNETDLLWYILHFATVLLCLHFISLTLWTFCALNVFCCGASALDRLIIIITSLLCGTVVDYWRTGILCSRAWYGMERKFRHGIWKMPEWNGMEDFRNEWKTISIHPYQFHTRFCAL